MRFDPPDLKAGADGVPAAGYFALVCVFLYAGFFQFGWGPVCWIYVSEIPAARLRSLNVAIAAATQWLFNFVVARATREFSPFSSSPLFLLPEALLEQTPN